MVFLNAWTSESASEPSCGRIVQDDAGFKGFARQNFAGEVGKRTAYGLVKMFCVVAL